MIFPASHLKISNEKIIELANNEINGNIDNKSEIIDTIYEYNGECRKDCGYCYYTRS